MRLARSKHISNPSSLVFQDCAPHKPGDGSMALTVTVLCSQDLMNLKIGLTKKNSPLMEWTYIKNIDIQTNYGMRIHHNTSPVN